VIRDGRMVGGEGARDWWGLVVTGFAWLLIAWLVLRMDITSIAAVGVLLGVVFLFASVNEVGLGSLMSGGWKILHYVMALIFFIGGLWSLVRPVDTFFALASVLGLILIFYGTFEIARAFSSRDVNPYWWIGLVTGILLLLLAFWVSGSDRVYALAQRTYLILFWVGFFALFKGITQIVNAFGIRHAGKVADDALTA